MFDLTFKILKFRKTAHNTQSNLAFLALCLLATLGHRKEDVEVRGEDQ